MQDIVDRAVDLKRLRHIMFDQREICLTPQRFDVCRGAGDEVIDANDFVAPAEETLAQVRTDESCPAGDECAHAVSLAVDYLPCFTMLSSHLAWFFRKKVQKLPTSA